jgi:hypothetical protein
MTAHDLVRCPVLRTLCMVTAIFFAGVTLETIWLAMPPVPALYIDCWGTLSHAGFMTVYGPVMSLVSGVLLLAYSATYFVTAFLKWRAQSELA